MADFRFAGEHVYKDMVLEPVQRDASVEKVREMTVVDGDVLIATYPKTGTTWMEELTWCISKEGDLTEALEIPLFQRMVFLEHDVPTDQGLKSGIDSLPELKRPAIMKTHLPASLLDKVVRQGHVKVIVTIRDPRDTLVSFYHFYRMNEGLGNFPGSWDDFFELHKAKHLVYGDYFDWYGSWLPYLSLPNVRLVAYEDMKLEMRSVIENLSNYLGKQLSNEGIETIIDHTSFTKMKSNDMTNYQQVPVLMNDISPFIRKGEVGDWKNYFSTEQERYVVDQYKKYKNRTDLHGLLSRYFQDVNQ